MSVRNGLLNSALPTCRSFLLDSTLLSLMKSLSAFRLSISINSWEIFFKLIAFFPFFRLNVFYSCGSQKSDVNNFVAYLLTFIENVSFALNIVLQMKFCLKRIREAVARTKLLIAYLQLIIAWSLKLITFTNHFTMIYELIPF